MVLELRDETVKMEDMARIYEEEIQRLRCENSCLKHQLYGRKSEKLSGLSDDTGDGSVSPYRLHRDRAGRRGCFNGSLKPSLERPETPMALAHGTRERCRSLRRIARRHARDLMPCLPRGAA